MLRAEKKEVVERMARRWCQGEIPGEEDIREAGLNGDEAELVAYLAGYNTNNEIHVAVRGGCRLFAEDAAAGR
jgi:hypothetical protein